MARMREKNGVKKGNDIRILYWKHYFKTFLMWINKKRKKYVKTPVLNHLLIDPRQKCFERAYPISCSITLLFSKYLVVKHYYKQLAISPDKPKMRTPFKRLKNVNETYAKGEKAQNFGSHVVENGVWEVELYRKRCCYRLTSGEEFYDGQQFERVRYLCVQSCNRTFNCVGCQYLEDFSRGKSASASCSGSFEVDSPGSEMSSLGDYSLTSF